MAGYYETIELNFMIAGHTKFRVDGNFGMIKKLYRKSTIYNIEQFTEVVRKSSPAGLNKVQCYENGQGFQYLDIKASLGTYFEKLVGIQKYHHFLFSADNPGVVKVQEEANGEFKEFNLLKTNGREIRETIKEIKNLTFTELVPPPLKMERQEYLYQKIRPLLPEKFRDITYSQPFQREINSNISTINLLS